MMKRVLGYVWVVVFVLSVSAAAQVALDAEVAILRAEDARDYNETLEKYLADPDEKVRIRAALAAGRIGDEAALGTLVKMLSDDGSEGVRAMAAFAIGEIESINGADAIIAALSNRKLPNAITAAAVEAAGKIAAANNKDPKAKLLAGAIADVLAFESNKRSGPYTNVILAALTAAMRASPDGAAGVVVPFLSASDPAIVADALNTLSRLRVKTASAEARKLLKTHKDAVVRANAARLLGVGEDAGSLELLLKAATSDSDSRVRISAVRSLAQLKDKAAAKKLIERANSLLDAYEASKFAKPSEQTELLEFTAAIGRLLANTADDDALALLARFLKADGGFAPEISIARVRISQESGPGKYPEPRTWQQLSTMAQMIGELAAIEAVTDAGRNKKAEAPEILRPLAVSFTGPMSAEEMKLIYAAPDVLRAYAAFKPEGLDEVLLKYLAADDVFMRVAAAEIAGERTATKELVGGLQNALERSLDKTYNDATLAIMNALFKLDKKASAAALANALDSEDHLVRIKAIELLEQLDAKEFPSAHKAIAAARKNGAEKVRKHLPQNESKLGQVLNTDADYRRAAARKNGEVKAVVTTEKGTFTIDLLPDDAPLTVDNFIKLANAKYFDGLEVHRVVGNFVMQDGDPLGNGSGGPGWSIRCEINRVPYERGAVGMALSGKDTGGSQWFAAHSRQPHLNGGYTVFGTIGEAGMKVVDKIVRGDRIISIRISE